MLALKVEKKLAQKTKEFLASQNALEKNVRVLRGREYVFFAVSRRVDLPFPHSFEEKQFEQTERSKNLKESLSSSLSPSQLNAVSSSYDLVGNIAVLEIPETLSNKKKKIAQALLESNPRIKTVLRKASSRKGEFRLKAYEWLAGAKNFVALHNESGCTFKVDLPNVYFSPRLSSERLRIASMVKNGEKILVLFSGVSPFEIVIAKRKNVLVKGVELNPVGTKLAKENIALNKLDGKIEVFNGNASVYAKKFGKWADRIVMPYPAGAHVFLNQTVKNSNKGTIIDYYDIGSEKEGLYTKALERIEKACKASKRKFKVLSKRKVLPYAPRVFTIAIDFRV